MEKLYSWEVKDEWEGISACGDVGQAGVGVGHQHQCGGGEE